MVPINKFAALICLLLATLTGVLVTSPLVLTSDSVNGLDGTAWRIDFEEEWSSMSAIPRAAYMLGDIVCHQKAARSYTLNHNQLPICARDLGLLLGMIAGVGMVATAAESRPTVLSTAARLLHVRRSVCVIVLMGILLGPLILDGFVQLLTSYDSTNVVRTLTGLLFGIGFALGISAVMLTDPRHIHQMETG